MLLRLYGIRQYLIADAKLAAVVDHKPYSLFAVRGGILLTSLATASVDA